jgi:hypothetical protein
LGVADGNEGGSSAGDAASGGADGNVSAGGTATGTTDPQARIAELEKALAKATGKAGSTQADLTAQLTAANNLATTANARAEQLARDLLSRDVLDVVAEKAPASMRNAVRLAARGLLPSIGDLSDPAKAAEAVIAKINTDAPELFKPSVSTTPRVTGGGDTGPAGVVLTADGKRLF